MSYKTRPVSKPKGQGSSDSSARTTAAPLMPDYPHDTFTAPKTPMATTSITGHGTGPNDGTSSKGTKIVNPVPPRCGGM